MSNFGSFSYFQTSLSLGVKQGLQKLPKYDINDLKLLFHCHILIPRKCPRKTPFKTQCPPPPNFRPSSNLAKVFILALFPIVPKFNPVLQNFLHNIKVAKVRKVFSIWFYPQKKCMKSLSLNFLLQLKS